MGLGRKNTCEFKFTNTAPARLDLFLRKKNLGLNEITIQSLDARDATHPHYYWVIAAWVRDQILRPLNLANMRVVFRVFSLEIRDVIWDNRQIY